MLLGGPPPSQAAEVPPPIAGLTLFLLLRAFSSGCAALTGVEAISNGVPAFRPPESKNAATTMAWMAAVLGTLFLGITMLSHLYGLLPREGETLVSQLARQVLGAGPLYYLVQAATMLILILWFRTVHGHYGAAGDQLSLARYHRPLVPKHITAIVPISHVNRAVIPVLDYIGEIREKEPDGWVTVLLPEVIPVRWWQNLLHNQRALIIRAALLFTPGVIVTAVPYHLEREGEVTIWLGSGSLRLRFKTRRPHT